MSHSPLECQITRLNAAAFQAETDAFRFGPEGRGRPALANLFSDFPSQSLLCAQFTCSLYAPWEPPPAG
ncbi:MAG TPA: hypothetical protein VHN15_08710 [Thermoanaerobaculia bacterium]|nr:hypothetical protein [Thermoanaerobaculia bacterium]